MITLIQRVSEAEVRLFLLSLLLALLAGCAGVPRGTVQRLPSEPAPARAGYVAVAGADDTREVALMALSLLDRKYRFGGRNPDSGLDCSGMVSWIFEQAAGLRLPHNAAEIARITRPIPRDALQPGDLVFFNTQDRPKSHVGIYIGEGRFVHAPSERGKVVKVEEMDNRYFAARFDGARTLQPACGVSC